MRLLLGLIKGGIIGGGLGFGFMQLPTSSQWGWMRILLYGVIGALVGFIAGRPFWRHETIWTPMVKAIFGFGLGIGLFLLVERALGNPRLSFLGAEVTVTSLPYLFGAAVGALYGMFVEVDDGGDTKEHPVKK
jgi:hypothetical protein